MAEDGDAAKPPIGENPATSGGEADPSPPAPASASSALSLSIWPPSQRTRDAVIQRLVETLSSPSVLTKRYGVVPSDEASEMARLIEQQAFAAAHSGGVRSSDEDGLEVLHVYSQEISKRMIDSVKSRASPAAATTAVESVAGDVASSSAESASSTAGAAEESSAKLESA